MLARAAFRHSAVSHNAGKVVGAERDNGLTGLHIGVMESAKPCIEGEALVLDGDRRSHGSWRYCYVVVVQSDSGGGLVLLCFLLMASLSCARVWAWLYSSFSCKVHNCAVVVCW